MGKLERIKELERELSQLRGQVKISNSVREYIDTLCVLPEDAVLLYSLSGMRIQHEIGKSARVLRQAFQQ